MRWRLVAILSLLTASSASAHHSGAMFDQAKQVQVSGTVREFQWVNPHVFIQLMANDERGRDVEWSLEMTAPVHLQRLGWRKSSLRPGDRITVTFHPLRNGQPGGNVITAVDATGKPIGKTA